MAAQQSQGIQTLLEAEKEAAKVVQQARAYRVQKLKDARSEAEKEIAEYKAQKETEFQTFSSERSGSTQTSQSAVDQDTEVKLAQVTSSYTQRKNDVVKKLLERAVLVEPTLHPNFKAKIQ
ncbi:H+-ATPase G subunit [Exidia glandulosa HHB12029]|uniref:V-type proton ATPase subunit G n=1 Tax=Exidia glandulosa HHB12029 TaxID=1314781 RepID=A0A165HRS1_EXIGL|nr:H+-ATPase G subunit [Exidia glandulosa HHB12029]